MDMVNISMISGPLHSPNSTTMNSTRPSISCIDGASSRLQKIAKGSLQSSCRTLSKLPNLYHESRAQPCGIRLKWNKNVRKPAGTLLPSRDTSFMQVKNIFWVLVHVHVKSMAPLSNSHTKGMAIRRKQSRTQTDWNSGLRDQTRLKSTRIIKHKGLHAILHS